MGAAVNSGLVHTVSVTPANVSDINQLPHLVREHARAVFGDKGYVYNELKRVARTLINLAVTGHIFNRLNEVLPDAEN